MSFKFDDFHQEITSIINTVDDHEVVSSVPEYAGDIDKDLLYSLYDGIPALMNKYAEDLYKLRMGVVALSNSNIYCNYNEDEWKNDLQNILRIVWRYEQFSQLSEDFEADCIMPIEAAQDQPPHTSEVSKLAAILLAILRRS